MKNVFNYQKYFLRIVTDLQENEIHRVYQMEGPAKVKRVSRGLRDPRPNYYKPTEP